MARVAQYRTAGGDGELGQRPSLLQAISGLAYLPWPEISGPFRMSCELVRGR